MIEDARDLFEHKVETASPLGVDLSMFRVWFLYSLLVVNVHYLFQIELSKNKASVSLNHSTKKEREGAKGC